MVRFFFKTTKKYIAIKQGRKTYFLAKFIGNLSFTPSFFLFHCLSTFIDVAYIAIVISLKSSALDGSML